MNAEATEAATDETAPAKKPRAQRVQQNGVSRPEGAMTGRVWEIADEISAREGRPALRAEVIAQCEEEGLNRGTITTQYGRWMTFNGVSKEQLSDIRKQLKAAEAPAAEQGDPGDETDEDEDLDEDEDTED